MSSKRWDQQWEHEVLVYDPKARCQIPAQKRLRPDAAVPPSQSDDCATEPQIQPRTLSPESDENVGILADVVARTKMQLAQEIFTLVNAQSALSGPSRNFRYMNIEWDHAPLRRASNSARISSGRSRTSRPRSMMTEPLWNAGPSQVINLSTSCERGRGIHLEPELRMQVSEYTVHD